MHASVSMSAREGIAAIALEGISLIEDEVLRTALSAVYRSAEVVVTAQLAERIFEKLTAKRWPADIIRRFLSGWRETHGTALFVSGLMIRLLREAAAAQTDSRTLLYQAAGEIGEIIPEDTGVDDTPHQELFRRFANAITGDDSWCLSIYSQPACETFRDFVKTERLKAPIEDAILTTAASENWNTGEYTFFTGLIRPWLTDVLGMPPEQARTASAYVLVHAGDTELGHFLHALKGWKLYCEAIGRKADPEKAVSVFRRYLDALSQAYGELDRVLG